MTDQAIAGDGNALPDSAVETDMAGFEAQPSADNPLGVSPIAPNQPMPLHIALDEARSLHKALTYIDTHSTGWTEDMRALAGRVGAFIGLHWPVPPAAKTVEDMINEQKEQSAAGLAQPQQNTDAPAS